MGQLLIQPFVNNALTKRGGTIGRKNYFFNYLKIIAIIAMFCLYFSVLKSNGLVKEHASANEELGSMLLALALLLPAIAVIFWDVYLALINSAKRIRDLRGMNAWVVPWLCLLLIPVIGVLFKIFLFLAPGKQSAGLPETK